MHAHYGLQEQLLLTAPLILLEPSRSTTNRKEVVMFLSDFTFQDPLAIFKGLKERGTKRAMPMGKKMKMEVDLNDVTYDAFLTNWRTLSDPERVKVDPGQEILLRVINGSSSTNFFVDLGALEGDAIAVDGSSCVPLTGKQFALAIAQRMDLVLKIPDGDAAYPILARGEGLTMQTGLILATPGAKVPTYPEKEEMPAPAITYAQEFQLEAHFRCKIKKWIAPCRWFWMGTWKNTSG